MLAALGNVEIFAVRVICGFQIGVKIEVFSHPKY
jgi:hypothetical protein